jgi:hypothetical protein
MQDKLLLLKRPPVRDRWVGEVSDSEVRDRWVGNREVGSDGEVRDRWVKDR